MRCTVDREAFARAFAAVAPAIPPKSPNVPAMSALFVADADGSSLLGTNLELGVTCRVLGVDVLEPGRVLLGPKFKAVLVASSDPLLDLATKDGVLTVKGSRTRHAMPLEDADGFPAVPGFDAAHYHRVAAPDLKRGIQRTAICTTENSTILALGGVKFQFDDGTLRLAGYDGKCLALVDLDLAREGGPDDVTPPSVPARALKVLERMLDDDASVVDIAVAADGNSICFRCDGSTLWTRLLPGKFPGYEKAFSIAWDDRATATVESLKAAIVSAATMTGEESRGVTLRFDAGSLAIDARAADVGEAEVGLDVEWSGAAPKVVRVDHRFALAPLNVIPKEGTVSVGIIDEDNAILFEYDRYRFYASPMALDRPKAS